MLILKSKVEQEIESLGELIRECSSREQFYRYLSILLDIKFGSELPGMHYSFDDLLEYQLNYIKKTNTRISIVNKSTTSKVIKGYNDPYEPLRDSLSIININSRIELFSSFDLCLSRNMGIDNNVDIIYEKNFWDGDDYDEMHVIYKPTKIIKIHDLGRTNC